MKGTPIAGRRFTSMQSVNLAGLYHAPFDAGCVFNEISPTRNLSGLLE